jgi:hypothetical protein
MHRYSEMKMFDSKNPQNVGIGYTKCRVGIAHAYCFTMMPIHLLIELLKSSQAFLVANCP